MSASYDTLDLREESLESWDYAVSDKLVYFCDVSVQEKERTPWPGAWRFIDWITKYKVGRAWLEFYFEFIGYGNVSFYGIANVLCTYLDTAVGGDHLEAQLGMADRNRPVLVEVAKFVELPEGVFVEGIPSVVRLKRLDDLNRFRWNTFRDAPELTFDKSHWGGSIVDGELGPMVGGVSIQQGKLPRKLVEPRSQVVGDLANEKRDDVGDSLVFKPNDVDSLFDVVLFRDGNRFTRKKQTNLAVKCIHVFFRPHGFYTGVG